MRLLDPKPFFVQASELAAIADNEWQTLVLPADVVELFCKCWQQGSGHKAIPANGQIRLYTSEANSEIITHCDLAKAMVTAPLYQTLHEYRNLAIQLANSHQIETFRQEFREKSTTQPASWDSWLLAIGQSTDLSDEEKTRFKIFLTDADQFYGIKGIAREDFASPALCKSIDKRIDRFSICGEIAKATIIDPNLFSKVQDLLTKRDEKTKVISKFVLPPTKERLATNLIFAALTKPFVILTGASGTGKTKLAESVARYLANSDCSNFKIVPVGADWTDNRHVIGFVNHLRQVGENDKRPIYQTTEILDLLLDAVANKDTPYFLILDEMNLSHVERYFADFLSVMERSGGRITLHKEGSGDNSESRLLRHPDDKIGVPQAIDYPQNLFVIGTVNIDETTYMFSPKVLDRANVIEFKVGPDAIGAYLENPAGYPEMKRAAYGGAEAFLGLSLKARCDGLAAMDEGLKKRLNQHLLEIYGIMEKGRYEFAYRTLNEVIRYLKVCHELAEAEDKKAWMDGEWKTDLDAQILQKILPKLHGSIGRISDLITGLADYCHRGGLPSETAPGFSRLKDVVGADSKHAAFPQSFRKLQAMAATLQSEQFVSFIR